MLYKFRNTAGDIIWEYNEPKAVGNDDESQMAIQKLFGSFKTPPAYGDIIKVGRTYEGYEVWAVGPFDVLLEKVK